MDTKLGDDRPFEQADERSESESRSEAHEQIGFAKLDRNHRAERKNAQNAKIKFAHDHRQPDAERDQPVSRPQLERVVDVESRRLPAGKLRQHKQRRAHDRQQNVGHGRPHAPGHRGFAGRWLLAQAHGDRRSRRDKWSSTTTTVTIRPLTRICMPVLAPTSRSMSVTVAMISAPMTVRPTEPHPPVTALPPTRIAAIASNV